MAQRKLDIISDLVLAGLRRGIENWPILRAKSPRLLTPRLPGATASRDILT